MDKNREKWILGVCCCIFILQIIAVSNQSQRLTQIESQLGDMRIRMNSIDREIERMNDMNHEDKLRTNRMYYEINSIDLDTGKAQVSFTIYFKEARGNSNFYLQISSSDGEQSLYLDKSEMLKYTGNINLNIKKNYEYTLIERFQDGREERIFGGNGNIDFYERLFKNRMGIDGSMRCGTNGDSWEIRIYFYDYEFEELGIDNVILETIVDGEIVKKEDITSELIFGTQREIHEYREAVEKGDIKEECGIKEFLKMRIGEQKPEGDSEHFSYQFNIKEKEKSDGIYYSQMHSKLRFRVIVKCKDGFEKSHTF